MAPLVGGGGGMAGPEPAWGIEGIADCDNFGIDGIAPNWIRMA